MTQPRQIDVPEGPSNRRADGTSADVNVACTKWLRERGLLRNGLRPMSQAQKRKLLADEKQAEV